MKFRPVRVLVSACQEKKIVFGIVGVLLPMRFPNGTAGEAISLRNAGFTGALGEIRTPDPQIRSLRSRLSASFLMIENADEVGVFRSAPCLLLPLV
jgi:hypothetical protein